MACYHSPSAKLMVHLMSMLMDTTTRMHCPALNLLSTDVMFEEEQCQIRWTLPRFICASFHAPSFNEQAAETDGDVVLKYVHYISDL